MSEVQNERTESRNRRRPRRTRGERSTQPQATPTETIVSAPVVEVVTPPKETRPPEIAVPTDTFDVYCVYHSASLVEEEPVHFRTGMTTLRHLSVDRFGGATLYCDCMHNGPHAWPPSMQKLETAVELDQFLAASTNDT